MTPLLQRKNKALAAVTMLTTAALSAVGLLAVAAPTGAAAVPSGTAASSTPYHSAHPHG